MPNTSNRLFIGVYPCGLVYADRSHEVHGDYKRLAFLPYHTLDLDLASDCPPDLKDRILAHAKTLQDKRGEQFQISACGQFVTLGK